MMGLEDSLPTDKMVYANHQICPNCRTDNVKLVNKGLAVCQSDDCTVMNFKPLTEEEIEANDDR